MRLRSWLTPPIARIRSALAFARTVAASYRVNPRAVVFGVACWLLFSGVSEFSPPAARIVLGAIFLVALLWPDRPEPREKK